MGFVGYWGVFVSARGLFFGIISYCFMFWLWQVKKSDGTWTDVAPVFRELASVAVKRSIMGYVNQLDLLNVLK